MSEFKRYSSIDNAQRVKFIEKITEEGYTKGLWSVKEKVHGANASIKVFKENGEFVFKIGKRSGYIKDGDTFHGMDKVLEKYKPALKRIFNMLAAQESITIYGERCGGNYPHPDVEKVNVKQIQKGVFYSPDHLFVAFDLMVGNKYLPTDEADIIFEQERVRYLPTLFKGTFEECLAYSNEFQSTIPATLDLPEIEGNICEGTVLKPYEEVYYLYDRSRVIIKNKNEKFTEIQGEGKIKIPKEPLPEEVVKILTKAATYCNLNRVANVVSKMGELKLSDFGTVMKNTNIDVWEDFTKDYQEELDLLESKHVKVISKKIGSYNAAYIKQYFNENI